MEFIKVLVLVLLIKVSLACCSTPNYSTSKKLILREKRGLQGIGEILSSIIKVGESLVGKAVEDLFEGDKGGVAGSIENYSKWNLIFNGCTIPMGSMNVPMTTVKVGLKEGFASHEGIMRDGNEVKCKFVVDSETNIYIAYRVPMLWNEQKNKLALSVCLNSNKLCNTLSADEMLDNNYPFLVRSVYDDEVGTIIACGNDICITGTMGTSRKSVMKLSVYPMEFKNLVSFFKDKLMKNGYDQLNYISFINSMRKVYVPNSGVVITGSVVYCMVTFLFWFVFICFGL